MLLPIVATLIGLGAPGGDTRVERKMCRAPDGVQIVYSVAGTGPTALVFVHGGMADRSFFNDQLQAFAARYRVVAVDLAGHGESGANRREWTLQAFGADVKAAVDAERLDRVILLGNSLGGPVAVEAARLLGRRAIGVVGIDTFQDLATTYTGEQARERDRLLRQRAEAFRADYPGAMSAMVSQLFHADADGELKRQVEQRMRRTPPQVAYAMLSGLAGYDPSAAARTLTIPLRAINGDLFPTDVSAIRRAVPDFDAVVMPHTGHYPMLEKPEEFNAHVATIAAAIDRR